MPYDFSRLADEYPVERVLAERYGVRIINGKAFSCPLPEHGGPDQSHGGSLFRGKDGRTRWHCQKCDKGGDSLDLVQAMEGCERVEAIRRLTGQGPPPPPRQPRTRKRPELVFEPVPVPADRLGEIRPGCPTPRLLTKSGRRIGYHPTLVHHYHDPEGRVLLITVRHEQQDGSKKILPVRWTEKDGWVSIGWQDGETRRFYGENELRARPEAPVLVVEGEKCADLLRSLEQFRNDYVVLSWAGGTGQVRHQPWTILAGRDVTFWPDADLPEKESQEHGPGVRAMLKAAAVCTAARIRFLWPLQRWLDLDDGFDAYDLISDELRGDASEARRLMEELSIRWEPPQEPPEEPPYEPPPGPDGGPIPYVLNAKGGLHLAVPQNWFLYMQHDGRFGHRLTYDVVTHDVLVDGEVLDERTGGVNALTRELGNPGPFRTAIPADAIGKFCMQIAMRNEVNRLAAWMKGLTWDQHWRELLDYAGIDRDEANVDRAAVAGWRWLLGLVQRVLQPGWQHDGVLVLEGDQGLGKSSFFRALGDELGKIVGRSLYGDLAKLSQDKEVQMRLVGKVVIELSEMVAQRKGEADALRGMITATDDEYRRPYARAAERVPRTCVFGGSTNEQEYLKDLTGNRRFWIVKVSERANLDGLRRDLPQLVAQAMWVLKNAGTVDGYTVEDRQNWLTDEERRLFERAAAERVMEISQLDGLDKLLREWPSGFATRAQIWDGLQIPKDRVRNEWNAALTSAMKKHGWKRVVSPERGWLRPQVDPSTLSA